VRLAAAFGRARDPDVLRLLAARELRLRAALGAAALRGRALPGQQQQQQQQPAAAAAVASAAAAAGGGAAGPVAPSPAPAASAVESGLRRNTRARPDPSV